MLISLFLQAAKLNVYHGNTFYYIGLYYRDIAKNLVKGTRCFEKAHSLSPKNEAIGSTLADQYVAEGKSDSQMCPKSYQKFNLFFGLNFLLVFE